MKRAFLTLLPLLLLPLPALSQGFVQPTCSIYNKPAGPFGFPDGDDQQHLNGEHFDTGSQSGSCTYSVTTVPCGVVCRTSYVATTADTGLVPLYIHTISSFPVRGVASANGGAVSCNAQWVMSVRSCVASCSFSVSINGAGPQGFGGSIGYTPPTTPLYTGVNHQ